jgi:hypothetical protein
MERRAKTYMDPSLEDSKNYHSKHRGYFVQGTDPGSTFPPLEESDDLLVCPHNSITRPFHQRQLTEDGLS